MLSNSEGLWRPPKKRGLGSHMKPIQQKSFAQDRACISSHAQCFSVKLMHIFSKEMSVVKMVEVHNCVNWSLDLHGYCSSSMKIQFKDGKKNNKKHLAKTFMTLFEMQWFWYFVWNCSIQKTIGWSHPSLNSNPAPGKENGDGFLYLSSQFITVPENVLLEFTHPAYFSLI